MFSATVNVLVPRQNTIKTTATTAIKQLWIISITLNLYIALQQTNVTAQGKQYINYFIYLFLLLFS